MLKNYTAAHTKSLVAVASRQYHHFILFISFILCTAFVQAQTNYYFKSIKATIQGTSSLHDWESEVRNVEATGTMITKNNKLESIKNGQIKMKVLMIKSKEGKIMDNKTFEAFKSDANPLIICSFALATLKTGLNKNITIEMPAVLFMAGTKRGLILNASGKELPNGDISIHCSEKLDMVDYEMIPPKAVMGTIKVGKDVTINFDIIISKK